MRPANLNQLAQELSEACLWEFSQRSGFDNLLEKLNLDDHDELVSCLVESLERVLIREFDAAESVL